MKKIILGLSLVGLAAGGVAIAQDHAGGHGRADPFGDRTVTRAEMQTHAAEMFAKMDANGDGKLDQADRAAHHAQRFAALDTNKDGQLSQAEFAAKREGREGGEGMRGGKHRMGHMGGHMGGKGMMAKADTNGDNAISRDEFVAAATARLAKADTNNDGQLTAAERQAAHAAVRAQWQAKRAAAAPAGN